MGLSALLAACSGGGGSTSTAPVLGAQPQAATVLAGKSATFSVSAPAEASATYQWRLNGQTATNGLVATGDCAGAVVAGATSATMTLGSTPINCNQSRVSVLVSNATGSTASSDAVLTVVGFTAQPSNKAVFANGATTLSVTSNAPAGATYQWQLNGASLANGAVPSGACVGAIAAGSNTVAVTLTNVPATCDGASFGIVVTVGNETTTSAPMVLAVTNVTAAPATATVLSGNVATFGVTTVGSATLQYAWQLNGQVVTNGPVTTGPCAGAVIAGATTASMTLSSAPTACHNSAVTATLTNADAASFTTPSVPLNVAGFGSQPVVPASVTSGTSVELTAAAGGFAVPSTTTWSLNGTTLSNGIQGTGACAGMTVAGATTSSLSLANVPASCSGTTVTATLSNTLGSVSTTPATLNVAAGDGRNGTYKAFATNGVTYELSVNFNDNTYRVVSPAGAVFAGTLTANTTQSGATEVGTYSLSNVGGAGLGGAVRAVTDGLVGNLQPSLGADAVPFIASKRFVRAATDIGAPIDLSVLGRDFSASAPNAPDSRIATVQISASGLASCSGNLIASVANCAAAGNNLLFYGATYNPDGSVLLVNQDDAADAFTAYFAKLGAEIVYLRASNNPLGVPRVRYGLQTNNTVGTTGVAATTDATWISALGADAALTMNGVGANGALTTRSGTYSGDALGSGLVTYAQAGGGNYFGARSPSLVVVVGARDFTRPTINGHMALGTANP